MSNAKELEDMTPKEIWNMIMLAYDSEIYALSQKEKEDVVNERCNELITLEWGKCGKRFDLHAVIAVGICNESQ